MPPCLTSADFDRLHRRALEASEEGAIRAHLSSCDLCRRSFEVFSSGADAYGLSDVDATIASPSHRRVEVDETTARGRPAVTDAATKIDSTPYPATDVTVDLASDPSALADRAERMARHYPRIEGYVITGVLGQGGMGIVYRAMQKKLSRTVALKVLPAIVGSANPAAVSRFRREATAAARLHHTHIIPIYDFGECADAYYYAMELITGQPLNDLIRHIAERNASSASPTRLTEWAPSPELTLPGAGAPLPAGSEPASPAQTPGGALETVESARSYYRHVTRWIADAADALHYAHGQGIIHRDIKPANLILSNDGRIMIADFGLAKSADEESVTLTGSLVGTMRYLSPEQAMAKRAPVDHRTDIYSLGATLYELLCFQPAFPGTDEKQILSAILTREPVSPRKKNASVPPELEIICQKAMEKSPDARYLTARAFAEDLRRYSSDLPIVARRPSLARRAVKFVRRHKAPVTAAVAGALLLGTTSLWIREQNVRREAQQQRRIAEVQSLYDSGMYYAVDAKWNDAEQEFQRALAIDPRDIKVILAMIWMNIDRYKKEPALATTGNLEKINRLCERVLHLAPDDLTALNYQSIILKNLKRYPEAIAATQRIVEINPDYHAAWMNLGAYHALVGQLDTAESCLQRGAALVERVDAGRAGDEADVWRNLAALELCLMRPAGMDHLNRAISLRPTDVASWALRVRHVLASDDPAALENALDDAKHADRLAFGRDPRVKRLLALAYLRHGRPDRAASEADAALAGGDYPAFNHLVRCLAMLHQTDRTTAQAHLSAALEAWPAEFATAEFIAGYDQGVLWLEARIELLRLRSEVEKALDS